MELAQAKSQGYLKNQKSVSSSGKKMLAVIGVYTGFGSHLKRNKFRGSWMPRGKNYHLLCLVIQQCFIRQVFLLWNLLSLLDDALKKLEERGVVIRFVVGRRFSYSLQSSFLQICFIIWVMVLMLMLYEFPVLTEVIAQIAKLTKKTVQLKIF